jgi:hypothetical protein
VDAVLRLTTTAIGAVSIAAIAIAGCLCGGYDHLNLTASVHTTSDREWETMAGRSSKNGIPPEFVAWQAAIEDASKAAPSSSVLALNGPGGTLYLDIPLPLTTGQTLPVAVDDTLSALSFANVGPPRDTLGARFEDFCTTAQSGDLQTCLAYQPPIQGTAQVTSTSPLVIHLDFTIEGWPGGTIPPHLVVRGDLVFKATRGRTCPGD